MSGTNLLLNQELTSHDPEVICLLLMGSLSVLNDLHS